ncbi:hypothetical protein [Myxococcus phage Mx1]|nr:hypothetical protein [Myxococcus phage Mx1]
MDQKEREARLKAVEKKIAEVSKKFDAEMDLLRKEEDGILNAEGCTHVDSLGNSTRWYGMYEKGCHLCNI